jgi:hypothetical protein
MDQTYVVNGPAALAWVDNGSASDGYGSASDGYHPVVQPDVPTQGRVTRYFSIKYRATTGGDSPT